MAAPSTHRSPTNRLLTDLDGRRVVLFACALGGLLVPAYFLAVADTAHLAWDYRAYYTAASAALRGESFVGIHSGLPGVTYVYPPVAVALFLPQAALGGWRVAFAAQTAVNLVAALVLAALVCRTVAARRGSLPAVDRVAVTAFCVGTAPAVAVLGQGQVDLLVAVALAGAFLALERDRQALAGVALAGAALVKVFPAALGLWLVWRRAWRALGAAVLTGLSGLAVGALWFGLDAYRRYLAVLAGRSRVAAFGGTVSPDFFAMTLFRPLSQALPTVDPHLYAPLAVLAVVPGVALAVGGERTVVDRLATYLVALAALLAASPASNALYVVYLYFPALCLLYIGPARRRGLLLGATAAVALPLQPAPVGAALAAVGAPAPVTTTLTGVLAGALTVASVPLLGLVAVLAWGALRGRGPTGRSSPDVRSAPAD